jgi:AbrB family looped-hinge helix DNA binding protein
MRKVAASKVTSKGQVTIPEEIRSELQLQTGDRVEWRATDHGTVEVRKIGRELRELVGLLGRPRRSLAIEEMDGAIAEQARVRRGRR